MPGIAPRYEATAIDESKAQEGVHKWYMVLEEDGFHHENEEKDH